MTKDEVKHLATLARIELTETEVASFTKEISAILDYVGQVKSIVGDSDLSTPKVGARYNVFRQDVITNEPDFHTKDLLAEMPKTEGRYLVVKKILNPDS